MSETPLVSLIVPAHNYGHLIEQTIKSMLDQTYSNLECVVVDDDSTDNTKEVVAALGQLERRVKYFYQDRQGVAAARNEGIRQSRGSYIQFLDADDLLERRKLELHVAYLEANEEVDVVYGSARFFRSDFPEERRFSMFDESAQASYIPELSPNDNALPVLIESVMPINTALVRRSVFEKVGLFDTKLISGEDADFWIRCAARGMKFQYHAPADTLALVRSHPISVTKNRVKHLGEMIELRKKIAATLQDESAQRSNRRAWSIEEALLGLEELKCGRRLPGMRRLLKASAMSGDYRHRAKWFACAFVAPFVSKDRLDQLPGIPVRRWLQTL